MAVRVLLIGKPSSGTRAILSRLGDCGWGWCAVDTLREGRELLGTFQLDVVPAAESPFDGYGYDVSAAIAKQSGTFMVGVALSENSLWLPVIERGKRVLGKRAIAAQGLESELLKILTQRARERGLEVFLPPRPEPKRAGAPRTASSSKRKPASAA